MEPGVKNADTALAPIGIHLPHNSLLSLLQSLKLLIIVMHSTMQETWKHSIHPAAAVTPHPVAGTNRLNITYRFYRPSYSPKLTPACKCGVEGILRCVMKKGENLGRQIPSYVHCNTYVQVLLDLSCQSIGR